MSKSIYEEALKESKDFGSFVGLKLDKVNNALEQAQKQEKLLELYRKIYHISPMKNETKESYWARVEYLDNKIKELENE